MYGMGDAIRGYQDDIVELKEELKEKTNYIVSLEFALSHFLDWYWDIEEPGLVPNSRELRGNLMFANRVLKNYRSNRDDYKENK